MRTDQLAQWGFVVKLINVRMRKATLTGGGVIACWGLFIISAHQ